MSLATGCDSARSFRHTGKITEIGVSRRCLVPRHIKEANALVNVHVIHCLDRRIRVLVYNCNETIRINLDLDVAGSCRPTEGYSFIHVITTCVGVGLETIALAAVFAKAFFCSVIPVGVVLGVDAVLLEARSVRSTDRKRITVVQSKATVLVGTVVDPFPSVGTREIGISFIESSPFPGVDGWVPTACAQRLRKSRIGAHLEELLGFLPHHFGSPEKGKIDAGLPKIFVVHLVDLDGSQRAQVTEVIDSALDGYGSIAGNVIGELDDGRKGTLTGICGAQCSVQRRTSAGKVYDVGYSTIIKCRVAGLPVRPFRAA